MLTKQAGIHDSGEEVPVWHSGALSAGCNCCKDGNGRDFIVGLGAICLANESGTMVQDAHGLAPVAAEAISFGLVQRHRVEVDRRLASKLVFPSTRTGSPPSSSPPTAFRPRKTAASSDLLNAPILRGMLACAANRKMAYGQSCRRGHGFLSVSVLLVRGGDPGVGNQKNRFAALGRRE